jgi:hypothetical protein
MSAHHTADSADRQERTGLGNYFVSNYNQQKDRTETLSKPRSFHSLFETANATSAR